MSGSLVILTGASGSGKTTIAEAIEATHPEITVLRFDTIGVPSREVMTTYGDDPSGSGWQRAMTLAWFERITPLLLQGHKVLFEGQMRIAFIAEALTLQPMARARILLVECDDSTRIARLTHDRHAPELANEDMLNWAHYLHREAVDGDHAILDTSGLPVEQSVERVLTCFATRPGLNDFPA